MSQYTGQCSTHWTPGAGHPSTRMGWGHECTECNAEAASVNAEQHRSELRWRSLHPGAWARSQAQIGDQARLASHLEGRS